MKRRKKSALKRGKKADAAPPEEAPAELPAGYGRTRVTLMEVDPYHVFAYWEVTPEDRARALKALRKRSVAWALRFRDLTRADGGSFDIRVDLASTCWYVDLWADEKTYVVDLGPLGSDGSFVTVCRSNPAHTPRSSPSPRYEPRWKDVDREPREKAAPPAAATAREAVAPVPPAPADVAPPRPPRRKPAAAPAARAKKPAARLRAIRPDVAAGSPDTFGVSSGLWGRLP
jgi:hypothetical protein